MAYFVGIPHMWQLWGHGYLSIVATETYRESLLKSLSAK